MKRTPESQRRHNIIIVNKKDDLPGEGADWYIRDWMRQRLGRVHRLTESSREHAIREIQQEVFEFRRWPDVLRAFKLRPARRADEASPSKRLKIPRKVPTGPESDAHKELKAAIVRQPNLIGLTRGTVGREEVLLPGGDRLDVFFRANQLGVEVKAASAPEWEIHRGIYPRVHAV